MVGFTRDPNLKEGLNQQSPKLEHSHNSPPIDFSVTELDDFYSSFADSFLDFDSVRDWIEDNPVLGMDDLKPGVEKADSVKMPLGETTSGDGFLTLGNVDSSFQEDLVMGGIKPSLGKADLVTTQAGYVDSCVETTSGDGFRTLRKLNSSIEEDLGKFTLEGGTEGAAGTDASVHGDGSKCVEELCVNESALKNGEGTGFHVEPLQSVETSNTNENGSKSSEIVAIDGDGTNSKESKSDVDESDSGSDSDSATSSSSSSGSDDDDDEDEGEEDDDDEEEEEGEEEQQKEKGSEIEKDDLKREMDMEEGEIRDSDTEKMVAWSDDENDEEDSGPRGPVRSKNEIKVLPPVPPVAVALQPYHRTLPLGVISSIIGAQVIVEGVEQHAPLNEGSILWITESRSPLGLVDEIFGPVKNPYYIVRYNSESEVPSGVKQGTSVSFVPEFANHVLKDSNLYKKGYDASGENDEELSDEFEFSDDEKEAEYKKMVKMAKRGTNEPKVGNQKRDNKKFKNRGGKWQNNQQATQETSIPVHQPSPSCTPQVASVGCGSHSDSFGTGQFFSGSPGLLPPFPQLVQVPGLIPPPGGVWTNGIPCEQQQGMVLPNGVPTNSMPWMPQNYQMQMPAVNMQMPSLNMGQFQQQFVPGQGLPANLVLPAGQSNFCAGPAMPPWPGCLAQNSFNQPHGMGSQCQQAPMPVNMGEQPHPPISGNLEAPQKFNQGMYHGRGRRHYNRGGGRFGGGRGWQRSNR